jgi:hypothetical protein
MPHIPVQKGKGQRTNVTVFRLHGYHDTVLCRQGKKKTGALRAAISTYRAPLSRASLSQLRWLSVRPTS